jgi:hypothetical protein
MRRRHLLLSTFAFSATASAQNQPLTPLSPVDAVNFYIVPTDGVSEQVAGGVARALTAGTGCHRPPYRSQSVIGM